MNQSSISDQSFLEANPILERSNSLLALSGGVDSMVLAVLLIRSGVKFSAAHCNFQLREKDSDDDEEFVRSFCSQNKIELFVKKFDVEEFMKSGNYSTQMAARELRYDWFEQLIDENGFDLLLTAHHLDDSVETFLINLSRGSGIAGLLGIQKHNQKIFRPLLNYSKKEIVDFAVENNIAWRDDRTNLETVYARNKIRHLIVPVLKEVQPEFLKNFSKTVDYLKNDYLLLKNHIEETKKNLFKPKGNDISISIDELSALNHSEAYLFHLFSEFGFDHPVEIEKLIRSKNSGQIESKTHRLIKNRNELLLTPVKTDEQPVEIELNQGSIIQKPLYLKVLKSKTRDEHAVEVFDFEKINFPLHLRRPKEGDIFHPLGVGGSKKLSKFFKDEKYSKLDKERAWVLTDNLDRILYIVGKRMDERFKITEHTQFFLNIYLC
ncbi:MAG: tRNA lysidine(34) synthetase TilS [Flavobacteriia bacterium]|nr:tRNA lysidine(34) synthetase TilS [Flavobacteriia bacterium]